MLTISKTGGKFNKQSITNMKIFLNSARFAAVFLYGHIVFLQYTKPAVNKAINREDFIAVIQKLKNSSSRPDKMTKLSDPEYCHIVRPTAGEKQITMPDTVIELRRVWRAITKDYKRKT